MASKIQLEFDGFDRIVDRLTKLEGDVKNATERALTESHRIVTEKAESAIGPHKKTGRTESTLKRNAEVQWFGSMASVEVGFNVQEGGLASIFLMYGTPRVKKDQQLYNAFFGAKTKKQIMQAQEEIFMSEIEKMGG